MGPKGVLDTEGRGCHLGSDAASHRIVEGPSRLDHLVLMMFGHVHATQTEDQVPEEYSKLLRGKTSTKKGREGGDIRVVQHNETKCMFVNGACLRVNAGDFHKRTDNEPPGQGSLRPPVIVRVPIDSSGVPGEAKLVAPSEAYETQDYSELEAGTRR